MSRSDRDIASAVNLLAFDPSKVTPFFIKNVNSNQCLSLEKFDNNERSTKLVQQPCRTGNAVDRWQQWYFYPVAGGRLMINSGSGDCVDVRGATRRSGRSCNSSRATARPTTSCSSSSRAAAQSSRCA